MFVILSITISLLSIKVLGLENENTSFYLLKKKIIPYDVNRLSVILFNLRLAICTEINLKNNIRPDFCFLDHFSESPICKSQFF